jgi:hypothetical protein
VDEWSCGVIMRIIEGSIILEERCKAAPRIEALREVVC